MNNTERSILSLFHEEMTLDEHVSNEQICIDKDQIDNYKYN